MEVRNATFGAQLPDGGQESGSQFGPVPAQRLVWIRPETALPAEFNHTADAAHEDRAQGAQRPEPSTHVRTVQKSHCVSLRQHLHR